MGPMRPLAQRGDTNMFVFVTQNLSNHNSLRPLVPPEGWQEDIEVCALSIPADIFESGVAMNWLALASQEGNKKNNKPCLFEVAIWQNH